MKLKVLLLPLIIFLILLSLGSYFVFTKKQDIFFKYAPDIYWKIQKEKEDIDLSQVSGRIVEKEGDDVLIINSAKGKRLEFLIPPGTSVIRFNSKMEREEIGFEEIEDGDYVLILSPSAGFYESQQAAKTVLVSSFPIWAKVEKYETD